MKIKFCKPNEEKVDFGVQVRRPKDVFLPRQDQLQDIMMSENANSRKLLMEFADYIEFETESRRDSFEKMWLAFVMDRKYNKWWNGSEWVDEDE